jgi:hypothetical protein
MIKIPSIVKKPYTLYLYKFLHYSLTQQFYTTKKAWIYIYLANTLKNGVFFINRMSSPCRVSIWDVVVFWRLFIPLLLAPPPPSASALYPHPPISYGQSCGSCLSLILQCPPPPPPLPTHFRGDTREFYSGIRQSFGKNDVMGQYYVPLTNFIPGDLC